VHFVTEELYGGPGILQGRLEVKPGETAEERARRVQAVEHRIYPEAAGWVGSGRVKFLNGQCWIDGKVAEEPVIFDY